MKNVMKLHMDKRSIQNVRWTHDYKKFNNVFRFTV